MYLILSLWSSIYHGPETAPTAETFPLTGISELVDPTKLPETRVPSSVGNGACVGDGNVGGGVIVL